MMFTSMYKDLGLNLDHWKKGKTLDQDFLNNILCMYMSICTGRLKRQKIPWNWRRRMLWDPAVTHMESWLGWQDNEERTDTGTSPEKMMGPYQLLLQLDVSVFVYHVQHWDRGYWSLEAETWSQAVTNWEHKAAAASFYTYQHSNLNQGRRLCQFWDGRTWEKVLPTSHGFETTVFVMAVPK